MVIIFLLLCLLPFRCRYPRICLCPYFQLLSSFFFLFCGLSPFLCCTSSSFSFSFAAFTGFFFFLCCFFALFGGHFRLRQLSRGLPRLPLLFSRQHLLSFLWLRRLFILAFALPFSVSAVDCADALMLAPIGEQQGK